LAIHGATCSVELLFQFLVFAPQALPLRLRPAQILTEAVELPALLVDDLLRVPRRRVVIALRHASVMPDSRAQYKRELPASVH